MTLTWLFFLIEFFLLFFLNQIYNNLFNIIILFILLNVLFTIVNFYRKYQNIFIILFSGLIVRLILIFVDLFGREIIILPNSAGDSEDYFKTAISVSSNIKLLFENIYGGLYSKFLGIVFFVGPSERILGHYINLLLGMSIIIITYSTLKLITDNSKKIKFLLIVITFFPQALIFSAILLRENIITLFVALSVNQFVKWFIANKKSHFYLSIIFIFIGTLFHSGVIGMLGGYFIIYIFYNRTNKKLKIKHSTVFYFAVVTLLFLFLFTKYGGFFGKLNQLDSLDSLYHVADRSSGGAAYLENIRIDSFNKFIFYLPIKMLYFLLSPLPHQWRNLSDVLTFLFSSTLYLYMIFVSIINYKENKNDALLTGLLISVILVTMIFGVGVSNAGTAMRHRHKILPVVIVILLLTNNKITKVMNSK